MATVGLFGIGFLGAGFVGQFLPTRDDNLISAARLQVLKRLSNPDSAIFSDMHVADERVRSWTSSVVQGCVEDRKQSDPYPTLRGFSVDGHDVTFRDFYCPLLP